MKNFFRVAYSIPVWIAYSLVALALDIIGIPLIYLMAKNYSFDIRESQKWPGRKIMSWSPKWAWIWGNEEDGIDGGRDQKYIDGDPAQKWWLDRTKGDSLPTRIFKWSALRNPSNNMRFLKYVNPQTVVPKAVGFIGSDNPERDARANGFAWYFCWQGFFTGFRAIIRFRGQLYRFWWGWKVQPKDKIWVDPTDWRIKGIGFSRQFKRVAG